MIKAEHIYILNQWKPAIIKTGTKYTYAVIQDFPVRAVRIRNDEVRTRPLLKNGESWPIDDLCLRIMDFGHRYDINKSAEKILNEAFNDKPN